MKKKKVSEEIIAYDTGEPEVEDYTADYCWDCNRIIIGNHVCTS